ncbi:MAG: EAL domain-containing protein [Lachnospiraceae bacterium]|nr:EAL domain-containing protein [Lachnospiraceae bacterium]
MDRCFNVITCKVITLNNTWTISIYLSGKHLTDPKLLDSIVGIIKRYDIPYEYIEIELTETTTEGDYQKLKKLVEGLNEIGIHTSIDDFGIGYSSLNLISELP